MNWRPILRHTHWMTIRIGDRQICICARCSGTVAGFISTVLLGPFFVLGIYRTFSPAMQISLAILLALPSGIDWITQKWGLRNGSNSIRFLVGVLIGSGACFLSSSSLSSSMESLILACSITFVVLVGYLGKAVLRTWT